MFQYLKEEKSIVTMARNKEADFFPGVSRSKPYCAAHGCSKTIQSEGRQCPTLSECTQAYMQ